MAKKCLSRRSLGEDGNTKLQDKTHFRAVLVLLARRPAFSEPSRTVGVVTSTKTGNSAISQTLYLRNKPNFNHSNITATSYVTVAYDTSQTKPQNGANPNKPNFFTTSKPLFSSSLWSSVFSVSGVYPDLSGWQSCLKSVLIRG